MHFTRLIPEMTKEGECFKSSSGFTGDEKKSLPEIYHFLHRTHCLGVSAVENEESRIILFVTKCLLENLRGKARASHTQQEYMDYSFSLHFLDEFINILKLFMHDFREGKPA